MTAGDEIRREGTAGKIKMRLNREYTIEKIASKTVLMPMGQNVLDGGTLFSLNKTGEWYARALEEELTEKQLFDRANQYFKPETEAEEARLKADLDEFLASLKAEGLLEC